MLALRIPLCITLLLVGLLPLELAFGDQAASRDAAATGGGMSPGSATEIVTDEAVLTSEVVPPDERFIDRAKLAFEESELVFVRSLNNAPFLPVAFLGNTHYGDAMVSEEGGTPDTAGKRYRLNSTSQYAGVPFLLNKRSALVIGEYLSYTDFSVDNGEDFSLTSATLAAGYLYQVNPDWQVMGGVVTRYTRNERLWWLFGVAFDDSDFGTTWIPYVGASLVLNERWSVSALLPWPQVIYAPSKDWFVSAGASYSGSSWAVNSATGAVGLNLSGFDFGFGGGMRLPGWGDSVASPLPTAM